MEIYRYITSAEQERIQKNRALFSRDGDSQGWVYAKGLNKKPIYGLPDNPLVWGLENTRNLLDWIFSVFKRHYCLSDLSTVSVLLIILLL